MFRSFLNMNPKLMSGEFKESLGFGVCGCSR